VRFFNTLSRRLEPFAPLEAGKVGFYTCGPTVYNFAHVGNFRAYIFEDLLRRVLKHAGFAVTQVMNLTDVDDKTIRGAMQAGVPLRDFTRTFKDAFFQDLKTLAIEPAECYPAATDHIPEMITLIDTLMRKGFAYQSEDKSVYFSISRFPEYGKLAHLDKSGLKAGARVAQDEYEKENLADFALWKAWDEKDGDVAWDSPWGRGRPGWHIECSAMSMKYLGESFDIHTGGVDNAFPHHEDEMAQSEAATGKQFVRYWLHCAHLVVEGKKMSKSLGNFFTLRDILAKGYTGREIRYVLLSAHYRQSLNFCFDALDGARAALERLDEFKARLEQVAGPGAPAPGVLPAYAEQAKSLFFESLEDDLSISQALSALFDLVLQGNRAANEGRLSPSEAAAILGLFREMDSVLGVLSRPADQVDDRVQALVLRRQEARQAKNWAESDRIRDELAALGWTVKDTPQGPQLKRL
jgi:cysteinyl-tRNA synthetase